MLYKSDITFEEKITILHLDNIAAADKPKGWHIDYLTQQE
jgi:Uri superfamily endonuclease